MSAIRRASSPDFGMCTIRLSENISLEAELIDALPLPEGAAEPGDKVAILLHPWSWLGGQMNDPVLTSLIHPLRVKGHHVLRYNSRGVRQSTGWASLTGFSEAEDLNGVVTWILGEFPALTSLMVIGYSHGALIASLQKLLLPPIKTAHVLLSYPLGPRGWLTMFHTNYYATKLLEVIRDENSNVLVIFGDRDEFTSVSKYRNWCEQLWDAKGGGLKLVEIADGTHFWRGDAGEQLRSVIHEWLL